MPPLRTLAALIAASLAAGCAVGPNYVRPDAPLPEHYLGQAALAERQASAQADLATWWAGFNDPDLSRYVTADRKSVV